MSVLRDLDSLAVASGVDGDRCESDGRWRTIEIRHLAALAAVAQEGSFRRAADRLGYVQSAISGQVAQLERAAGARLVERASGSATVELTVAGRLLVSHTEEINARLREAYADVAALSRNAAGTVRVAGLERFAPRRAARVVRCFRERYPETRLALEDAGSDERNFELVIAGSADLAVGELPLTQASLAHVVLEHDPYALVVAASSPLAQRDEPPTAEEMASLRLIIPTACRAAGWLDRRLRERRIERRADFSVDSVPTAQALVSAGLGQAILPRSLLHPAHPGTATLLAPDVLPERTTVIAVHAERECSKDVYGFLRAASVACEAEAQEIGSAAR